MTEEWFHVNDKQPPLNTPIFMWWKDREVVVGIKAYDDCDPCDGFYSWEDEKSKWVNYWTYLKKPWFPKEKYAKEKT